MVTRPNSLTLTSIIDPFVKTPVLSADPPEPQHRRLTERGVERRLGVFLDTEDRKLECRLQFWMGNIGDLHSQSHGPDESLQLDGFTCETLSNKRSLVDHSLPRLLLVFTGFDDLEHLYIGSALPIGCGAGKLTLLGDSSNLRQRYSVLGSSVLSPILDRGR